MRLTNRTDIAVRTLMYLAIHDDRIVPIDEIVEKTASHRSQVVAAVQKLRKTGYIKSTVGRSGGVALDRDPGDIRISSIVKLIEPDFFLTECHEKNCAARCTFYTACQLRSALDGALEAFFAALSRVTLADLVDNKNELLTAIDGSRSRNTPEMMR
ncbi:Rrf2 family transcriptional regulator [Stappia sp. ES.058]|uniref:RrF2 family transcriptional regulator n=1 Tax=Stappia sp. ES.058 TaxID=1881061 RepID=UPI00087AD7B1|nr:Rrf2 family transcriptional regulator [Stappia sp. ES.058]SDT94603.1 transcriptional regulator, BadM/Rrf2 family [Stappia sp. ES.058]